MPAATAPAPASTSPTSAELVVDMIKHIRDERGMNIQNKLAQLSELSVERILFDSPEQAFEIISIISGIIASDPAPEVRAAALMVMEQMIALEEKAEATDARTPMNWHRVDVMLGAAKRSTERDTAEETVRVEASDTPIQDAQEEPAPASPLIAERPQPAGAPTPGVEDVMEPPILKFLRSVAGTDSEENIRALANRVLVKIEALADTKPPAPPAPALTKG